MAATFRSASNTTLAARTNTTITAPAGIANGDLLVIFFAIAAAGTPPTPTPPAGFSALAGFPATQYGDAGTTVRPYAWVKVASSESGNYTVTHASATTQGVMLAVSGAPPSLNAFNPAPTINEGTGSTTTALGLTTVGPNSLIIYFGSDWGDSSNNLTAPGGTTPTFTERVDVAPLMYVATGVLAAAGATGNKTQTNNSNSVDPWIGVLVAISNMLVGSGSSVGAATVTAAGSAIKSGAGSSDGAATVASVGSIVLGGVGSSDGTSTVDGVGEEIGAGGSVGDSAGAATVSGTGESTGAGDGISAGTGAASGTGTGIVTAAGAAAGSSTADAIGSGGTFEGVVATRCRISVAETTTGARTSRTYHYARDDVSSLKVAWANWYATGNAGETATGNAVTLSGSIEYPAGTFHQLKFGGSNTVSVASGGTQWSDACAVSIPRDAKFYVRLYLNPASPSKIPCLNGDSWGSPGAGQMVMIDTVGGDAVDTTHGDLTMSGSLTDSGQQIWVGPAAIVAVTSRKCVGIVGSSRLQGLGDDSTDSNGDTGEVARTVGEHFGYINLGVSDDTASSFKTSGKATRRIALLQFCNVLISSLGDADIAYQNASGATAVADAQACWSLIGVDEIYAVTMSPISTSTNGWIDVAHQTPDTQTSRIKDYNDLVRAVPSGAVGYLEVADQQSSAPDSGKWNITPPSTPWTYDGRHDTVAAYEHLQSTGVVTIPVEGASAAAGSAAGSAVSTAVTVCTGLAAAAAVVLAVGLSIAAAVGVSAGSATVQAAGSSITTSSEGAGASAGTAGAAAVGLSTSEAEGAAAGAAGVDGTGQGTYDAVGASSGASTGSGTASSTATAVGASAGASSVEAQGDLLLAGFATGHADGSSTAVAVSAVSAEGSGAATGDSTASAGGSSICASVGAVLGAGSAAAVGVAVQRAVGASGGLASATGVATSRASAQGSASGTASAAGVGSPIAGAAGTAGGLSTSTAVGRATTAGIGASNGLTVPTAVGTGVVSAVGDASGASTVVGTNLSLIAGEGFASAGDSVDGVGSSTAASTGLAEGTTFVDGWSPTRPGVVALAGQYRPTLDVVGGYTSVIDVTAEYES